MKISKIEDTEGTLVIKLEISEKTKDADTLWMEMMRSGIEFNKVKAQFNTFANNAPALVCYN